MELSRIRLTRFCSTFGFRFSCQFDGVSSAVLVNVARFQTKHVHSDQFIVRQICCSADYMITTDNLFNM